MLMHTHTYTHTHTHTHTHTVITIKQMLLLKKSLITIAMRTRLKGLSDSKMISLVRRKNGEKNQRSFYSLSELCAPQDGKTQITAFIFTLWLVLQFYPCTFLTSFSYSARVPFSNCTRRHTFYYLASSLDYQLFDLVDTDFVEGFQEYNAYIGVGANYVADNVTRYRVRH